MGVFSFEVNLGWGFSYYKSQFFLVINLEKDKSIAGTAAATAEDTVSDC